VELTSQTCQASLRSLSPKNGLHHNEMDEAAKDVNHVGVIGHGLAVQDVPFEQLRHVLQRETCLAPRSAVRKFVILEKNASFSRLCFATSGAVYLCAAGRAP